MIGLLVGAAGLCTGGGAMVRRGTIEFHGGCVKWILAHTGKGVIAMTLGHAILGQAPIALDLVRDHEQVHVRQYERWGPFFIPVYLAISMWLWIIRRDPYRDNPFEIEAYDLSDPGSPTQVK